MTKKTVRKLLAIVASVFVCGTLGIIAVPVADMVFSEMIARQIAYRLAPPQYPSSDLVTSWTSGGSDSMWDRRTYSTTDSTAVVVKFMEQYLPIFQKQEDTKLGVFYISSTTDKSPLARHAAEVACHTLYCYQFSAYAYPSASVTVYDDPKENGRTLIEVWLSWPAR
jgi:hypothetical protein